MSRRRFRSARWTRLRVPAIVAGALSLIVLLEATGLASVPIPAAGLIMKALTADLSFGSETPAAPVAPQIATDTFAPFDFSFPDDSTDVPLASSPRRTAELCPEAGPTDFPDEQAGFDAKGLPLEGSYLWKAAGKIDLVALGSVPVGPYDTQTIQNVKAATDGSFTYDYTWSTLLVGVETDTIHVVPVSAATADNPAGIYLAALHQRSVNGDVVDFTPLQPVLLLSLPVSIGAAVGSAAPYVDPTHQRAMSLSGTVQKRERFDACGTVIEAWQVSGGTRVMTSIGAGGAKVEDQSTTFDFAIAPQLGGLFVALHRVGSGSFSGITFQYDTTSSIGTLNPRPFPKAGS